MDISMPGKNGIELCKEVKEQYKSVFVLVLSTFNQQSFIQKMMEAGASGYVLKNVSQPELMEFIIVVAKGKTFLSNEAAAILRNDDAGAAPIITRKEKEVLELLADGLANNEIAEKLFVSAATVDSHRKSLILKLNAKNTPGLIKLAFVHKLIGN